MDVLVSLSESHLRAILVALCDDRRTRNKVAEMADMLLTAPSSCGGSDLAICIQCKEAFSTLTRAKKECRFHPGDLEVDYEDATWADHDENCHGLIDTDENREDHPDGFIWTCCDEAGSAVGCEVGPHRSQ